MIIMGMECFNSNIPHCTCPKFIKMEQNVPNMVFVKTSLGSKNVPPGVFLNTPKVGLNWFLEVVFTNYIWMYLQNASHVCK